MTLGVRPMRLGYCFIAIMLLAGCSESVEHNTSDGSRAAETTKWTPSKDSDLTTILEEASEDARKGKYASALAKHIWFHDNILESHPSYYGVRLSFALSDWARLAKKYPPALDKLNEISAKLEKSILACASNCKDSFSEFSAINRELGRHDKLLKMFQWADKNQPALAQQYFLLVKPSLIDQEEYELSGKYTRSDADFEHIRSVYRYDLDLAERSKYTSDDIEYAEEDFVKEASLLVEILARNGRNDEAAVVAENAQQALDSDLMKVSLQRAMDTSTHPLPEKPPVLHTGYLRGTYSFSGEVVSESGGNVSKLHFTGHTTADTFELHWQSDDAFINTKGSVKVGSEGGEVNTDQETIFENDDPMMVIGAATGISQGSSLLLYRLWQGEGGFIFPSENVQTTEVDEQTQISGKFRGSNTSTTVSLSGNILTSVETRMNPAELATPTELSNEEIDELLTALGKPISEDEREKMIEQMKAANDSLAMNRDELVTTTTLVMYGLE